MGNLKYLSALLNILFHRFTCSSLYFTVSHFCFLDAKGCKHHSKPSHHLWRVAHTIKLNVILLTLVARYTKRMNSFHAILLIDPVAISSFPPHTTLSDHGEPWPCLGVICYRYCMQRETVEKYFLQIQTKCRMIPRKCRGESLCAYVHELKSHHRLLRSVCATVMPLQGTMLTAGTKRFLLCGLPMCEEERQQQLWALQKSRQRIFLKSKHNCRFS